MKSNVSGRLLAELKRVHALHRESAAADLSDDLLELRRWQAQRLADTHSDWLADTKARPALEFFLDELYGPRDFSQRDADLDAVFPIMRRVLPERLLETLLLAMELNALSHRLDEAMVGCLRQDPQWQGSLSEDLYARAYRCCGRRDDRVRQIELIARLASDLDAVVHRRGVALTLRLARRPARAAGFGELQAIIERGYQAFKALGDPQPFIDSVVARERTIMQRLLDAEAEPFSVA